MINGEKKSAEDSSLKSVPPEISATPDAPVERASVWKLGGLTWRELGARVWAEAVEGDLLTRCAALSYYFLLALFPLLLFLIAMLGFLAETGTALRTSLLIYFAKILPRSASTLIYTTVDEITKNATGGKLSFGLLTALWVASSGISAMGETLNAAYGVRETRPWWRARLSAIGLTIALAVLILFALLLVLYGGRWARGSRIISIKAHVLPSCGTSCRCRSCFCSCCSPSR
jgi:membrane protein